MDLSINKPSTRSPRLRLWLSGLLEQVTTKRLVIHSLVAMDWDDHHAVLGWLPEPVGAGETGRPEVGQIEIQIHAIPEGLMVQGQWQDARAWLACLERWVAATPLNRPQLVLALPAEELSHQWLDGPSDLDTDRSDTLEALIDEAMSRQTLGEHSRVPLEDQVFDVLPMSGVWPGTKMLSNDSQTQEFDHRWCLVGAPKNRVSALEDLFAQSDLQLACLDVRWRALLACWHQQVTGEGNHCLLDDHLSTTQWIITGRSGVLEMGHLTHQRLSLAERSDHLIGQLASAQANHALDALWLSAAKDSQSFEVADRVAETLNLNLNFLPSLTDHTPSSSLQAVVQGLLLGQASRAVTHGL